MVGGISIPTLNLPQAGRASMAPPSQYNSQSTLSQTQSLKKGYFLKSTPCNIIFYIAFELCFFYIFLTCLRFLTFFAALSFLISPGV